jgi:hypothetical protein
LEALWEAQEITVRRLLITSLGEDPFCRKCG